MDTVGKLYNRFSNPVNPFSITWLKQRVFVTLDFNIKFANSISKCDENNAKAEKLAREYPCE